MKIINGNQFPDWCGEEDFDLSLESQGDGENSSGRLKLIPLTEKARTWIKNHNAGNTVVPYRSDIFKRIFGAGLHVVAYDYI